MSLVEILGRPLEVRDALRVVDALVVLGSPTRADGTLSPVGEERVRQAVTLWRRGVAPIIVFTGAGADHTPLEAPAMARLARELGVPDAAIRLEARSRNTRENASFTAELLAREGWRSAWLVSQSFHLRRSRWLFRRAGVRAHASAVAPGSRNQRLVPRFRWLAREYAALVAEAWRR